MSKKFNDVLNTILESHDIILEDFSFPREFLDRARTIVNAYIDKYGFNGVKTYQRLQDIIQDKLKLTPEQSRNIVLQSIESL